MGDFDFDGLCYAILDAVARQQDQKDTEIRQDPEEQALPQKIVTKFAD